MSERSRKKRKDDTWTNSELSSALSKSNGAMSDRYKSIKSSKDAENDYRRKEKGKLSQDADVDQYLGSRKDHDRKKKRRDPDESTGEMKKEKHRSRRHDENRSSERRHRRSEGVAEDALSSPGIERKHRSRTKVADEMDPDQKERRRSKKKKDKYSEQELYERESRRHEETEAERRQRKKEKKEKSRKHRDDSESRSKDDSSHKEKRSYRFKEDEDSHSQRSSEAGSHSKRSKSRKEKHERRENEDAYLYKGSKPSEFTKTKTPSPVMASATNVVAANPTPEDDGYNYDDEDFEDYEDDFEDENDFIDQDDDSARMDGGSSTRTGSSFEPSREINEIISAINQENERANSAKSIGSSTTSRRLKSRGSIDSNTEQDLSYPASMSTFVNFGNLKKSQAGPMQRRVLKRQKDLGTLIQLDTCSYDIFELSPVSEYNFYIKSFGDNNARQISTQTNDDTMNIDVQTDGFECIEKWTQHPPVDNKVCGTPTCSKDSSESDTPLSIVGSGTAKFSDFVGYANKLLSCVVDEDIAMKDSAAQRDSKLSFCSSSISLNTALSYLKGRSVQSCTYENGLLAVAYSPAAQDIARVDHKGLVVIWKVSDNSQASHVLVCDAIPVVCTFVPAKSNLVLVGANDGSILLYDLSEQSSSSFHQSVDTQSVRLKHSTYQTSWHTDAHTSPITSMCAVGQHENGNQVLTVEESSKLVVWSVVDVDASVEDDIGLSPNGRYKLLKSVSIDVTNLKKYEGDIKATCATCPFSNVFYIGTDVGLVLAFSRTSQLKMYEPVFGEVPVSNVSFNQTDANIFVVSYKGAFLSIFHTQQQSALFSWKLGMANILNIDWSLNSSAILFGLDSANKLHLWDLVSRDSAPLHSSDLSRPAVCMCVEKKSSKSCIMIAYEAGNIEVHSVLPKFTSPLDNSDGLLSKLTSFF